MTWSAPALFRGQHDPFGGGTEGAPPLAVPDPDSLAHTRWRNAFAHAVNLAGAVAVRNDAGESDLAGQPGAAFDIGRVDAGGGEAHPDLTPSRLWRLQFRDPQHVAGRSVRLVVGSAHGCSLALRVRSSMRMMTQNARRDDYARRLTCPGKTSNTSALPSMSAKAAASAPVIQACAPRVSSSA